jgi:hypothetical protein
MDFAKPLCVKDGQGRGLGSELPWAYHDSWAHHRRKPSRPSSLRASRESAHLPGEVAFQTNTRPVQLERSEGAFACLLVANRATKLTRLLY